jgi:hypothetical protein
MKELYDNRDNMMPMTFGKIHKENKDYEEYYGKPFEKPSKKK